MKIGVIGGGQLGRMMALAGTPLGMQFAFLDPAPDACAQALGEHIRADYGDQDHLRHHQQQRHQDQPARDQPGDGRSWRWLWREMSHGMSGMRRVMAWR
jgi:3-hydroxyacyl-CoA dehydrogenase